MKGEDEIAINYAWDWFSYHASQRMIAFNFFLIIVGALGYGYLSCGDNSVKILICYAGIVISLAFLLLDFRNAELVDYGKNALCDLEKKNNMNIVRKDKEKKACCHFIITHALWLRLIEALTLIVFISRLLN